MPKARYTQNQHAILFDCPGCKIVHMVWVKQPEGGRYPIWEFNGDMEKPTITPSVSVNANVPIDPPNTHKCHSFITDGKIQFLSDCTHPLAGQTVDLPDLD